MDRDSEMSDGRRVGMGIGLYLCAAIIHAHGSRITACNLPEGGASFVFTLDLEDDHEQQ